jgi:hypothetical protein
LLAQRDALIEPVFISGRRIQIKDVPDVKNLNTASLETERPWPQVKTRPYTTARPLSQSHPDQVLTFVEWCSLNRLSERTGRRIMAKGEGPTVLKLSAHRVGITIGANKLWEASRERS